MLKKKVCLLGSFAVGKTSLVARFVHSMFSGQYHTTVGVRVDKKVLEIDGQPLTLMIWDLAGDEEGAPIRLHQARDASGYLLVADGTRASTLDTARSIHQRVENEIGMRPFLLLINKADLRDTWDIADQAWTDLAKTGWTVIETSALTGEHVEEAFTTLAGRVLKDQADNSRHEDGH